MSKFYSRDKNHKEICDDLRKMGVTVKDLSKSGDGLPDIVTHKNGKTCFIEIKFDKVAKVKKSQVHFLGSWSGYCGIAETTDEAYKLATEPEKYALTYNEKQKLLAIHAVMKTKEIHYATLKKELNK